ncbi:MAG: Rossmann-like domain-containing protein [Haloarculaceae archaeon]
MSDFHPTAEALLTETLALVRDRVSAGAVTDVATGPHMGYVEVEVEIDENGTAPETDDGRRAGVVHLPDGPLPDLVGRDAVAVVEAAVEPSASRPARAAGLATLNALSAGLIEWRPGDPVRALTADVDAVAMVGLFGPVVTRFEDLDVRVVERDPADVSLPTDVSPSVDVSVYGPDAAADAFDGADVALVTGSTLVYGGLGRYLAAASPDLPVVLVGATASFLPGPLFDAGVSVLAGARVTDRERVRDLLTGPRCGQKLHGNGLQKVYARPDFDRPLPGLDFGGRS